MTVMATAVRVDVCGQLKVIVDGKRREADARPQIKVLIGFLALHRGRTVGREDLVRAVWGEDAPPARQACLSSLLSRARGLLREGAIVGRGGTSLHLSNDVTVDFHDARRWLSDAEAALAGATPEAALQAAERAIAIADRGVLVGEDCAWLEDWRRDLAELGIRARECAVEAALLAGGSGPAAVDHARQLVAAEPYLESAHGLLMRALAAQGNVAHALAVYEQLRTRLDEELGLAPGPQLRELHARLLRADVPVRAAPPVLASSPVGLPRCDGDFVGRVDELRALAGALDGATRGRAGIVLVEGEAGIGKTRLAMQFARDCERRGVLALYGRCDAATLSPYQPLVEALRRELAGAPPPGLGERISAELPVLARLLPELDDPGVADDNAQSHQVVDAFCAVVRELSRERALVIVIDDLHWADAPTLLLLRQLVRCTADAAVLLVASYRPAERGELLEATLADLQREHELPRIVLRGLGSADARALIGQDSLVYWERSRGNPFFLKELKRHGASGDGIPHAIRDVIRARLARLSMQLREVLEVASVAGNEFSIGVLEGVCDLSEDALDDALREGVDAHVIAELPVVYGGFEFEHGLTRETIYGGLTRTRRARLHLRVGEALERLGGAGDERVAAELAHHFQHAPPDRGLPKALEYAERAARHALGMLAFEDAVRHYEHALATSARLQSPGRRRHELLLALGGAQGRAGDLAGARRSFGEAADLARALDCPRALARAVLGCGVAGQLTGGVIDRELVGHLEEALRTLENTDDVLRSRLLARLAIELSFAHDRERLSALTSEAVALARRTGDPDALSWALIAFHWSLWTPENVNERLEAATELLTLAVSADSPAIKLQGHRWRLIDLLELGDIAGVDAELEAYAALAHERRQPADLWYLHLFAAMRLLLDGDYERADAESRAAVELGRRVGDANAEQGFVLQQLLIARDRGGLGDLEAAVREHVARFAAIPGWRCTLALLLSELGREDEARAELAELARDRFTAIPRDGLWLGALSCLAEVACTTGDRERAAVLYELLTPFAERAVTLGFAAACCGPVSRPLALLAATLGDRQAAELHFDAALSACDRMGARPYAARVRSERERLLR